MKFLKLALTLAMLWTAAAIYTTAQVVKQSNSNVNKAKTSSKVEKKAEPQYYELRCRGGVTYQTDSTYHLPIAQKLDFFIIESRAVGNVRMMNMLVNFIPGTERVAPTGSNLEVAHCSWLDRGFRPEEPTQLRQEIAYFGQLNQLQNKMPIDPSPAGAERYPDSKNVPEYLKDPNRYWSFLVRIVHNGGVWGADIFEAVSSHYWKPLTINQEIQTPPVKGAG